MTGVIRKSQLEERNANGNGTKRLSEILGSQSFPHLHPDQSLHLALDRMGATKLDVLPVVSRANVHQLEGILTLKDVLAL